MVQIKHIIISLALLVSTFAIAESVNETHSEHKEHTRFGMHGMVLITDGVDLCPCINHPTIIKYSI